MKKVPFLHGAYVLYIKELAELIRNNKDIYSYRVLVAKALDNVNSKYPNKFVPTELVSSNFACHAVHDLVGYSDCPYCPIDWAALADTLESELDPTCKVQPICFWIDYTIEKNLRDKERVLRILEKLETLPLAANSSYYTIE